MKLYEIAAEYQQFIEAVENGEIPEEAIGDTLESIEALIEEKADNLACLIKNITAEVAGIKAEEQNLAARRKAKEKQVDRIKKYLSETLQKANMLKIETARNKISFRKSESVKIENEEAFIEWAIKNADEYLKYESPSINKSEIKKSLANGAEIVGASLETKNNMQIK